MSLEANVAAAKDADEYFELAGLQPARFWTRLQERIVELLPPKVETAKSGDMTRIEAQDWARANRYQRGMHVGLTVHEVQISYADWWNEHSGTQFEKELARYLRSVEAADRRERESALFSS